MAGIGAPELIIVLLIVLLLFGGAKLPKLAKSLGEAKREFEKSANDSTETAQDATKDQPTSN
jgi:sec-independent protein translocase protein TatA